MAPQLEPVGWFAPHLERLLASRDFDDAKRPLLYASYSTSTPHVPTCRQPLLQSKLCRVPRSAAQLSQDANVFTIAVPYASSVVYRPPFCLPRLSFWS